MLPLFGDSLSTSAALTPRKASDTDAVTARRILQRPLLGGRKSISLRVRNGKPSSDKSKITEVGIQHISQDESHSFAYDAAAAVIAGGRPFSLFESRRWRYFLNRIKPGWKPPNRAVVTRILPDFYQELYDEVFKRITSSEWFNIIFDASDNVSGHRIVNISVQLPDGPAFYWKTFDTGDEQHTADNWVKLIWREMQQLCGGDLSRINSICTDTENTMRSVHDLLGRFPELSHINFSLCDSHGLPVMLLDWIGAGSEPRSNPVQSWGQAASSISRTDPDHIVTLLGQ
ncbi:hypothetical protein BFJ66_g17644 [Fusarium oxysporum f. sp. cepae]|nr:hypothetical protein BFJ66_g17644 [Fusarium oxysporum f. sp. cepae]